MKIQFSKSALPKSGVLVVTASEGGKLGATGTGLDKTAGGAIARALKTARFAGAPGQIAEMLSPSGLPYSRLLVVGIGKPKEMTGTGARTLGGKLAARLRTSGEKAVVVALEPLGSKALTDADFAAHLAQGAQLRVYDFGKYHTKRKAEDAPSLDKLTVLTEAATAAKRAFAPLEAVREGVDFTRDLVSEPANVLFPKEFSKRLKELTKLGVKVEVLGEKEMTKLRMNALLGVGHGSQHESQMVVMHWSGGRANEKPLAMIGKGVCFDTGGISLKPGPGMEDMKWDMGGAGVVSGLMMALAKRKAKVNVVGLVGLVENMPDGKAQRPGDVVKSASGQTIEILNTDAEGRLVLCDVLWYAQQKIKPKLMIDLATLTGAIIMALGSEYAGLFSNDDDLAQKIEEAGKAEDEPVWRFPMGDAYDKMLNSPIADIKNIGGRFAGSITAAQFLQRFVNEGMPWAHLDIAGTVWRQSARPVHAKGATGYGVRLLNRLIADNYEK